MRAILLALVACDALDGHIDRAEHCCQALDVEACLARFTEPGRCHHAECLVRGATVCRLPDGGLGEP